MICYFEMDLSLDEIIKKNNIKSGNKTRPVRSRSQSRPIKQRITRVASNKNSQTNGKDNKTSRGPLQSKDRAKSRDTFKNTNSGVVDARMKIIQKSRRKLMDARDKLSTLPKQTDARAKIKSRSHQRTQHIDGRRERLQDMRPPYSRTVPNPVVLQRSIRNNVFNERARDPSSLIRCTINRTDLQPYEEDMEIDTPISIRARNDLSGLKIVAENEYQHYRQEYMPSPQEPIYIDHYEQPMPARQLQPPREYMVGRNGGRMSQEMRARLDTPAKSPPQYNFVQSPYNPRLSQGHRIVVSNLHPSVTHEDITELFEDIGPLLTSRLVRAGTAEVIYKFQNDAKKAVEAYHNRQLDGQPMKCLLVNPRPSPTSSGILRSNSLPVTPKYPVSSKSMVVPDLSAIHKALFTHK